MFFDDWKWKLGQNNPEPQMSTFQGFQKNPNAQAVTGEYKPINTYTPTYDSAGYNRALERWKLLEDEERKQQAIFQDMAMGTPQQASLAQMGAKKGGGNSNLEITPFGVTAMRKNTRPTLSDFDVPHFLKKWRY